MAYWLVKSEPASWSWAMMVEAGAAGTAWTGVRNHVAKQHLMAMRVGEAVELAGAVAWRDLTIGLNASWLAPKKLARRRDQLPYVEAGATSRLGLAIVRGDLADCIGGVGGRPGRYIVSIKQPLHAVGVLLHNGALDLESILGLSLRGDGAGVLQLGDLRLQAADRAAGRGKLHLGGGVLGVRHAGDVLQRGFGGDDPRWRAGEVGSDPGDGRLRLAEDFVDERRHGWRSLSGWRERLAGVVKERLQARAFA